jgi:ribosomal protein S18 acetylase RimI-like enzyme
LFYCDLGSWREVGVAAECPVTIERNTKVQTVAERDLQQIINVWNPKIMQRLIAERFDREATLWLAKSRGELAGYGWTLNGGTMEPHFFPLGADDVHLFDFFVFPEFRGRWVNRFLVLKILEVLVAEKKSRAYIEVAEWNRAQLNSLGRMPFKKLGYARKFSLFGRTLALWSEGEPAGPHTTSKTAASNQQG